MAHSANSSRSSRARNSTSLTKRKSMPSISPGRGGRVVTEIEYARPGTRSRTSRHSVVLPAPEGAETTKSEPRRLITRLVHAPLGDEARGEGGGLERRQDQVIALGH